MQFNFVYFYMYTFIWSEFIIQMKEVKKNQLKEICSWKKYNLKGYFEGSSIVLQLLHYAENRKFMYEVHADLAKYEKNLFQNAEQLFQYLSDPQNMIIDIQRNTMTVVGSHPIKKSSVVELLILGLQEISQVQQKFQSSQLLALCSDANYDICKESNLRYIIGQLIKTVNSVVERNISVEVERVINKLECVGNQMNGMQMKTADILLENHNLTEKTTKLEQQIKKVKLEIEENLQAKSLQTKYLINQFMEHANKKQQKLVMDLEDQKKQIQYLQERLAQISGQSQPDKIKKIQKIENNKIQQIIRHQIDTNAKFFKHFAIKGRNICKVEDFIFPTILIGLKSIRNIGEYKIKIHQMGILKKIYPGVCVGIVDSKHKHKQSCDNNDNVIEYSCAGKLFEGNKYMLTEGNGFQNGDYVHVKVNFQQGTIIWMINDKQSCKHTSKNIINKEIDWRPYVFMRDKGDSIEWVLQE